MIKYLLSAFLILFVVSCKDQANAEKTKNHKGHKHSKNQFYYTCSMHPQIREDKSGKCPICHMNLTKVEVEEDEPAQMQKSSIQKKIWQCKDYPDVTSEKEEACPVDGSKMVLKVDHSEAEKTIAKVKLRKAQLSHFRPAFFTVSPMMMTKKIRLLGSVMQSEDKESNIPARIGGRVEKVYVKSTGSLIKLGDPVVDLYSPQLITGGEEYLIARKSYEKSKSKEFKEMVEQSEERLKLWGVKSFQFKSWFEKGKVPRSITLYSPSTGIVRARNATVGKYFKEGQNFFELSDLSDVWVEMDVYEHDSNLVKIGQRVELRFAAIPGEVSVGEIDFVNPVLNKDSRTLKVRATISNGMGKLKPGMVADASLEIIHDGTPLVIPRSALIDTGKRKVAWVKINEKSFQAKVIHTGHESQGYVEVKHGLMNGEQVVIEGNFLLDAQAQLFGGYEKPKAATVHKH